jgi:hypothetical protein
VVAEHSKNTHYYNIHELQKIEKKNLHIENPGQEDEITALGIRYADHTTPFYL